LKRGIDANVSFNSSNGRLIAFTSSVISLRPARPADHEPWLQQIRLHRKIRLARRCIQQPLDGASPKLGDLDAHRR
jgi:hypothetical protein